MSTGMSIGGSVPRYKVPAEKDLYFGNYARPYKDSVTLSKYSKSLFYNQVGYTPRNYTVDLNAFAPVKKTKATKKNVKRKRLRKNIKKQPVVQKQQPQPATKPGFWTRIGRWFSRKYDAFNNFIEQPFATTMNMFRDNPKPPKKITFGQAATQSVGNIALKIVAMPILAPLAVAGLMYTSIKPMVQYWNQQ